MVLPAAAEVAGRTYVPLSGYNVGNAVDTRVCARY
jgi:hypothetical protein